MLALVGAPAATTAPLTAATTPREAAAKARAVIALVKATPGCPERLFRRAVGGLGAYSELHALLEGGVTRSEVRRMVGLSDRLRMQHRNYCN